MNDEEYQHNAKVLAQALDEAQTAEKLALARVDKADKERDTLAAQLKTQVGALKQLLAEMRAQLHESEEALFEVTQGEDI